MIVHRAWLVPAFFCFWIACGADEEDGAASPADAAAEVTGAMCDWIGECGQWQFDCDETGCTADLLDTSRAECVADRTLDGLDQADCADLTASEQQQLDSCIDGLASRPCVTQSEVDAYLAALEAGEEPDLPGEPAPAACDELAEVFVACAETAGL